MFHTNPYNFAAAILTELSQREPAFPVVSPRTETNESVTVARWQK